MIILTIFNDLENSYINVILLKIGCMGILFLFVRNDCQRLIMVQANIFMPKQHLLASKSDLKYCNLIKLRVITVRFMKESMLRSMMSKSF